VSGRVVVFVGAKGGNVVGCEGWLCVWVQMVDLCVGAQNGCVRGWKGGCVCGCAARLCVWVQRVVMYVGAKSGCLCVCEGWLCMWV